MDESRRLESLSYRELQRECKARGVPAVGKSADLKRRLETVPSVLSALPRTSLQAHAKRLKLPAQGRNTALLERVALSGQYQETLRRTFTITAGCEDATHWMREIGRQYPGKRIRVTAIDGGYRPPEGERPITKEDYNKWSQCNPNASYQAYFDHLGAARLHLRASKAGQPVRVQPFGLTFLEGVGHDLRRRMLSREYDFATGRSNVVDAALRHFHWSENIDSSYKFQLLYPGDLIECIVVDEVNVALSKAIEDQLYAEQLVGNCILDPMILYFQTEYEKKAVQSSGKSRRKQMDDYSLCIARLEQIRHELEATGAAGVSRAQLQTFVDQCGTNPRVQIRMHQPCTTERTLDWQVFKASNQKGGHIFNFLNSRKNHADLVTPVDRTEALAADSRAQSAAAAAASLAADEARRTVSDALADLEACAASAAVRAEEARARYDCYERPTPKRGALDAFLSVPQDPAVRYDVFELDERIRDCVAHGWPVMWKQSSVNVQGHCELRVTRVHTAEGVLCGESQWAAYSKWSREANIGAFSLDWMRQHLASRFVNLGLHWNVRSQWYPDSDVLLPWVTGLRDAGKLQLVDIAKSYATFHSAPFYEKLPGRLTFMYATDTCEHGPGFYYLKAIDWSTADLTTLEILRRLGEPIRARNVYARPILRLLQSLKVSFTISCGIWAIGESVDLKFPEHLIETKEYARIVGLWANVVEHEALCMPGNRRWAEHLRATSPKLTKVFYTADDRYGGEGVVQKEFLKTSATHHIHWAAYINAYEFLRQFSQLRKMDLTKVIQIKKDDIMVIRHDFELLPCYRDKTDKLPHNLSGIVLCTEYDNPYCTGVMGYSAESGPTVSGCSHHGIDPTLDPIDHVVGTVLRLSDAHSKRFAHLVEHSRRPCADIATLLSTRTLLRGPGGSGKTDFVLKLGALCPSMAYCVFQYRLLNDKLGEYAVADDDSGYTQCKRLTGCVKDVLVPAIPEKTRAEQAAAVIVIDECQTLSCQEANLIRERYPYSRVIFCGDPGFQIPGICDGSDAEYQSFDAATLGLIDFEFAKIFRILPGEEKLLALRAASRRLLVTEMTWEEYRAANAAREFPAEWGGMRNKGDPGPVAGHTFEEVEGFFQNYGLNSKDGRPTGLMRDWLRYRHRDFYDSVPHLPGPYETVQLVRNSGLHTITDRDELVKLYDEGDMILCGTNFCAKEWTQLLDEAGKFKQWNILAPSTGFTRGEVKIQPEAPPHSELAHAFTVHKTIGLTAKGKIFIELRNVWQREMMETALGRATRWDDIVLLDVETPATFHFYVYAIYSLQLGLVYVGHTLTTIESRFAQHRGENNSCTSKQCFAAGDTRWIKVEEVHLPLLSTKQQDKVAAAEEVEGGYMTRDGLATVVQLIRDENGVDCDFKLVNEARPGGQSQSTAPAKPRRVFNITKAGTVTLTEDIDYGAVDELLRTDPANKHADWLRMLLHVGRRKPLKVKYGRKKQRGRLYATRLGDPAAADDICLQNCPSALRPTLIGRHGHDVDIVNSGCVIAKQYVEKHRAILDIGPAPFQALCDYVDRREEVLDSIASHYNIDRKAAKRHVIKAMFGGHPCDDLRPLVPHPTLLAFTEAFKVISAKVSLHLRGGDKVYQQLYETKLAEKDGNASRAAFSVFAVGMHHLESECIIRVCQHLHANGAAILAIVHDGVIASKCTGELLRGAEQRVQDECGYSIKLAEKPLFLG